MNFDRGSVNWLPIADFDSYAPYGSPLHAVAAQLAHNAIPLPELFAHQQFMAPGMPPHSSPQAQPVPAKSVVGDVVDKALAIQRSEPPARAASIKREALSSSSARPIGELSRLLRASTSATSDVHQSFAPSSGPTIVIVVYCPNAERTPLRLVLPESVTVAQVITASLRQALKTAKASTGAQVSMARITAGAFDERFAWLLPEGSRRPAGGAVLFEAVDVEGRAWELLMHDAGGEPDIDFPPLERTRAIRNFASPEPGSRGDVGARGAEATRSNGQERVAGEYCLLPARRTSVLAVPSAAGQRVTDTRPDDGRKSTAAASALALLESLSAGPGSDNLRVLLQLPNMATMTVCMVPYKLRQVDAAEAAATEASAGGAIHTHSNGAKESSVRPDALVYDIDPITGGRVDEAAQREAREAQHRQSRDPRVSLLASEVITHVCRRFRLPTLSDRYVLRMSANDAARLSMATQIPISRDIPPYLDLFALRIECVELLRRLYQDSPLDKQTGLGLGGHVPAKDREGLHEAQRKPQDKASHSADEVDDDSDAMLGFQGLDITGAGGRGPGGGGRMYEDRGEAGALEGTTVFSFAGVAGGGSAGMAGASYIGDFDMANGETEGTDRAWVPPMSRSDRRPRELSSAAAGAYQEWLLVKINRHGRRQNRVLGVDGMRLTNRKMDKNGAPTEQKERMIADIVRIEVPDDLPTRFSFLFRVASDGASGTQQGGGKAGGHGQGGPSAVSSGLRALGRSLSGFAGVAKAAVGHGGGMRALAGTTAAGEDTRLTYDTRTEAERDEILTKLYALLQISGEAYRVVRV